MDTNLVWEVVSFHHDLLVAPVRLAATCTIDHNIWSKTAEEILSLFEKNVDFKADKKECLNFDIVKILQRRILVAHAWHPCDGHDAQTTNDMKIKEEWIFIDQLILYFTYSYLI